MMAGQNAFKDPFYKNSVINKRSKNLKKDMWTDLIAFSACDSKFTYFFKYMYVLYLTVRYSASVLLYFTLLHCKLLEHDYPYVLSLVDIHVLKCQ